MFKRNFQNWRRPKPITSPQDRDLMIEILLLRTERDREAILRFYVDRVVEGQIEADFRLSSGQFRELRRSVRTDFWAGKARIEQAVHRTSRPDVQ